ncbi:MAG: copper resistance protein CopB [Alphaproteobacteria bacterium CG11_big_fil_rev_8_21_14_0_20_44_7]|nr:MAG: copper resistance protein CopB [Alphaproteobacteria bacterium CG11_big_fil_rev_8_21_14_0_20_44_7]|tara:strand:- start:153 stop:875 length:723 start_codon:yes stop_codon:yes gene_type:complete
MCIKTYALTTFLALTTLQPALASEVESHKAEHGGQIFHAFRLEADVGAGQDDPIASWDFDGWIGGDVNKLWLKSEGEVADGNTEQAEFWALYSRNVATFWDAQIGIRHDTQPESTSYLALGVEGLAPYFFETEAHLFVSDEGDVSARIRQENDFLITQRLIIQPYVEANLYAQDVADQEVGAGLANAEFGLQTRYEITRKFAPYVDLRYERKFGETSSIAKKNGEDNDDFIASIGLRLMF